MASQELTLHLPQDVVENIQQTATRQRASLDEVVAEALRFAYQQRTATRENELLRLARKRRPQSFQKRYRELIAKRQAETLTPIEYEELLRLNDQAEEYDSQRQNALIELAALRNTDLHSLMGQLGMLRRG